MRTAHVAVAAVVAVVGPVVPPAHATGLSPVAQCSSSDVHKAIPYAGYAYTPQDAPVPTRLTLVCTVESYWERHSTRQSVQGSRAVALAAVAVAYKADPMTICATAVAEYPDGTTASTTRCGQIGS